jgi:hypothetical protein
MIARLSQKVQRVLALIFAYLLLISLWSAMPVRASDDTPLAGDALKPPSQRPALASADDPSPTLYQPSAFLAGRVAVQIIFVESDGTREPSHTNWTPEQVAEVQRQIDEVLQWWRSRVPNARVSFNLTSQIVPSGYEPIDHALDTEGEWIGDVLAKLGVAGGTYFDQAYAADAALRRDQHTDWATTIFVVNSTGDPDGRFADDHFAYAYIGGPFLVVTSDAGPYGMNRMAPVVAHEFGHIFGALDQYATAATPCTQQSGYLAVPTTNSQSNSCGTRFICIMLEPLSAYQDGLVDQSALGQIGYRDSDGDSLPDPIDTTPALQVTLAQPPGGGRPTVEGKAIDQPFPAPLAEPATINTIAGVEYRIDGGEWFTLPAADGAFDSASEQIATTLPLYDGRHTVEIQARNSVGATSPILRQQVDVSGVGAAPAYQVEAPPLSNTPTITLSLAAPTGTAIQISESPVFADAPWSPIEASDTWSLVSDDGAHTLYIRFRDANGLESPPFVRTVLLDCTPPTGRALLHTDPSQWIELQVQDGGSGIAAVRLVAQDGSPGDWQPFQPTIAPPAGSDASNVYLRDAAGNISAPIPVSNTFMVYLPSARR